MKDLKEYLAGLFAKEERLGLRPSGIMESIEKMDSSEVTPRQLGMSMQEFLERLRADNVRQGGDASSITEIIESPDSSSTTNWVVVMIPQRPQPKRGTPKG